uniref:Vps72/YL1 C-terminal domain-containing protein n=1 Tax=Glossina brevipalpis TaxID=37001 RepID=A0A1A9W949_9MUSC
MADNTEIIPTKKIKTDDKDYRIDTNSEDSMQALDMEESCANDNSEIATVSNLPQSLASVAPRPKLAFKNPKFSYIEPSGKKFVWKSLKQIIAQEKSLPWSQEMITYNSLNAPPSLKPAKKYSDISGLIAPYMDPQTKLYYHNAEEFRIIRSLPSDIIQGYLALRGATNIVG